HVGGNADAGVADGDDRIAPFALSSEPDASAGRGVLGGVVEQIRYRLTEARRVGVEPDRIGRHVDGELMPGGFDDRLAGLDRGLDDFRQLNALTSQLEL